MRYEYKRRAPCSLLELRQLHLIMFGHLYHVIDVPMNSVGGLIEDDTSAIAYVVRVLAPVCSPLAYKYPLVLGQYLRVRPAALAKPVFALLRLRVDRFLP